MNFKKYIFIIGIAVLVIAILIATAVVIHRPKNDLKNDLEDIVGEELFLSDGLSYCEGANSFDISDSFSKSYSSKTTIKVVDFDKEKALATVEIQAPPLRDIMLSCVPSETFLDYEQVFENYMDAIEKAIQSTAKEDMVLTTIECRVSHGDGEKLVMSKEFISAIYPDIYTLMGEVLLNALGGMEE